MSDQWDVQSHKGNYTVIFRENAFSCLNSNVSENCFYIIDDQVARLYAAQLGNLLEYASLLRVEATEAAKTLDRFTAYVEHLVERRVRRGMVLVAIGGGIIQDITCFLASTFLRGLEWRFYPTTLLAQADSCIGSKSSINVGGTKNILGTYNPPKEIVIDLGVLTTLSKNDLRSGVGEMLKVHGIDGPDSFDSIAADYSGLFTNTQLMRRYIDRSLKIKKRLIELDEFDQGPRNVMNYGHSFAHAIEAATHFGIPHGIAVSMGMDMAHYIAVRLGILDVRHFHRMHPVLFENYADFKEMEIPFELFMTALGRDKKNTVGKLRLVLPDTASQITIGSYDNDEFFQQICQDYITRERHA